MPRRPLPRAVQAVKFMAEPWLTYDQAIELVRGRLRGDRSRERALDVLRAALITGEIPMEPAEGFHSSGTATALWSPGSIAIIPRRRMRR